LSDLISSQQTKFQCGQYDDFNLTRECYERNHFLHPGILSFNFFAYANDRCPDKVLDTYTIEGKCVGIECEDKCCATIFLDNNEEFTFLYGEDAITTDLQNYGNRVRITINVGQFWNTYGNECSRYDVFHSTEAVPTTFTVTGFDYGQCINNAGCVALEMVNCMQTSISILKI